MQMAISEGGNMVQKKIEANLAMVEAHFGSEADGRVDEAVGLYTDDIIWEAHLLEILSYMENRKWQTTTGRCFPGSKTWNFELWTVSQLRTESSTIASYL